MILSLVRDLAMDRVRRRLPPRQYQMYELYVVREWSMEEVRRFLNVSAPQIYWATVIVCIKTWVELARMISNAKLSASSPSNQEAALSRAFIYSTMRTPFDRPQPSSPTP
jgi:hypothetical protein